VTAVSSWFSGDDDEVSLRARSSGLAIAFVALLAVPAWGGFDLLLEPDHARTFILLRLACEIPILAVLWPFWLRPVGRRYPELLTCLVLAVVQFEIAWMLVRASEARDFYLLGFSLALYGSGCLMGGRPRWTGVVVGTTWLALGVALVTAPHSLSSRDLAAAGFYLATASIIGFVGHVQRERLGNGERMARLRLEREQEHTSELLAKLDRLSHEDPLTGLANRRRWDAELDLACAAARSNGTAISVVLIDIDRFKDVNDRHGHHGGDQTLREVAVLLTSLVRHNDLVARIGGDEYGVLLLDTDAVGATEVAEKLRAEALRLRSRNAGSISLSLGVAAAAGGEALPDQLMKRADGQLYRAKETRNAVAV
jgi:diguanylate cyclase (GGDEF)-like protein